MMQRLIAHAWHTGGYCLLIGSVACVLAAIGPAPVWAQSSGGASTAKTADEYFHEAARQYIGKEAQQALATVEQGLQQSPDHPKLLALREKLRQEGGQQASGDQQNQSGQQSNPSSDQQSEQQSEQQNREGESGNQNEQEDGSNDPSQRPNDQPNEGQQNESQSQRDGSNSGSSNAGNQRPSEGAQQPVQAPGTLSRAQAERILEALEGQEKQLLREVQKREARPYPVEKDW